jgi:hypothetical protein
VQAFLSDREIKTDAGHGPTPQHVGVWEMRGQWASKIVRKPDRDFLRRARMLESEFMLRWVSLDLVATCALVLPPAPSDLGEELLSLITRRPSSGAAEVTREAWRSECVALDAKLDKPPFTVQEVNGLAEQFKSLGQQRSTVYEPAIRLRAGATKHFGRGFAVYASLKPDLIVEDARTPKQGEYTICALTNANSDDPKDIADALRRTGHAVEFTAFLRANLEGLEDYVRDKIERYGVMLESV